VWNKLPERLLPPKTPRDTRADYINSSLRDVDLIKVRVRTDNLPFELEHPRNELSIDNAVKSSAPQHPRPTSPKPRGHINHQKPVRRQAEAMQTDKGLENGLPLGIANNFLDVDFLLPSRGDR